MTTTAEETRRVLRMVTAAGVLGEEADDLDAAGVGGQERLAELVRSGLLTPEALDALREVAAAHSGTVACSRISTDRAPTAGGGPRSDSVGGLSAADGEPTAADQGAGGGGAGGARAATDAEGAAFDLAVLPERLRRELRAAALLQSAVDAGYASRERLLEELARARAREVLYEVHLLQEGVLDRTQLRALGRSVRAARVSGRLPRPENGAREVVAASPAPGETSSEDPGYDTSADTLAGLEEDLARAEAEAEARAVAAAAAEAQGLGFPGEGGRLGNYTLLRRVAEGGMGVVFQAREDALNRVVALKVMRGGALASPIRRRRFLAEAEAAAALHHPNIVPIHHIGEAAGYPFYTMDYVEGRPLHEWARAEEPDAKTLARLMRVVADAVHHFHLRGIIHRDLKPDNVLITEGGAPRIIDFGIAKKISTDFDAEDSWTVEGEVLGTPYYMPPEQAVGSLDEIDTRSDVYALGAILYQLLAGKPPFHEIPAARVVLAIEDEDPTPLHVLAPVDRDLEAIVNKAMAKRRERRYQSALEFAQDLERYVEGVPTLARPVGLGERMRKLARRHRAATAVVALAFLGGLLGSAFLLVQRARQRARIQGLLAAGRSAPLDRQAEFFARAVALDPRNGEARAELARARAASKAAEELRLAEERRRAELAKQELAREREQQQIRLLQEAERARAEAAAAARREAEETAKKLLARAEAARSPLEAVGFLGDALVRVPEGEGNLGARIARSRVAVCLQLAESALAVEQVGLARYWLREARKLRALRADHELFARAQGLAARLEALGSGRRLVEEAKRHVAAEQWLLARRKFEEALARGVPFGSVRVDADLVRERCSARARELLDQARALLREEREEEALTRAREAAEYASERDLEVVRGVLRRCAAAVAQRATREAQRQFLAAEGRERALETLGAAIQVLGDEPVAERLRAERAHRRWLLEEAPEGLLYVPALPRLGTEAFCVQRTEVSNADFARFVRAGGYRDDALWDRAARGRRSDFVDSTPGGGRPGPRFWRGGRYGEEANALLPVRGVTWYEARAYARWLRRTSGLPWRLPRAEEWEAAAGWDLERGALRSYPWGDRFEADALPLGAPQRVGKNQRDRSFFGLCDAGGNVAEWVDVVFGRGARPGLKGAPFSVGERLAAHLARVRTTGSPSAFPPRELLAAVGFRLVLRPPRGDGP
ncbi:MAG: hypothetical protein D6731_02570 [Planctomycetota bacterium]|nr:MAG: hypothetical protein D6731_02570 [Planctomycetota bacterium]